eukprot:PITA_17178
MKLTTWNIRGLGSRRKQRNLSNRIKEEKLDMIFIQKTKCSMEKIREIHSKWLIKYDYLEVKENNSAGGILTLWDPQKFGILDAEATRNYLYLVCSPVGDKEIYMITNVYGPQKQADKLKLLTSLEDLRARYPNMPWIVAGPAITASILPFGGSDHWPVQLEAIFMGTLRNRPLRFENAWLSHPKFTSNIDKWWKEDLNIQEGFNEERQKLTNSLQEEWEERCLQEENFWRQKSRIQWIEEGEKNTKFFHKSTMAHMAHNRITKIKDSQGVELVSHKDME